MATKFLEPGGDSTFNANTTTNRGFWTTKSNSPDVVTDFVHGSHIKSIKFRPGSSGFEDNLGKAGVLQDAGTRLSFYLYLNSLPSDVPTDIVQFNTSGGSNIFNIHIGTDGTFSLTATLDIGNGSTLSTGQWYRISVAYTITSTTVNRFEAFINGVSDISGTNKTLPSTGTDKILFGNTGADTSLDFRISDIYIDDSSSLTDTGDIWVTAKRPVADGLTNGFLVQVGAGGSGYGTGHSPQVNERPASQTNGWQTTLLGTTEEYTIEAASVGDINITGATIVDYVGWIYADASTSVTGDIIVGGSASNVSLTTTKTMFTKVKGSTSYPGGGTDIGMVSSGSVSTETLYECGIMVAYTPAVVSSSGWSAALV